MTGLVTIKDENRRFIIDPSSVFTGNIDDDNGKDAVITVISYEGNYLGVIEHLIIININGSLIIQKSIESDMRILGLKNGLITAEVPECTPEVPLSLIAPHAGKLSHSGIKTVSLSNLNDCSFRVASYRLIFLTCLFRRQSENLF